MAKSVGKRSSGKGSTGTSRKPAPLPVSDLPAWAAESPGQSWRATGAYGRFRTLANHYQTAEAFADAMGVSVRSLRAVFRRVMLDGETSPTLESDAYAQAMRRARHRMTDQMRRRVEKAQRGGYSAPIIRTPINVIVPAERRYQVSQIDYSGKLVIRESKSAWTQYHVEFMTDSEIHSLLAQLHSLFMDTGQFNSMRYDYIAEADAYADGKFRDDRLRQAQKEMEYIKISSSQFVLMEQPHSDDFADFVMQDWQDKLIASGQRIMNLYFANFDDLARSDGLKQSRAEFKRWQQRRRGNGGKFQRGDGRGI